MSRKFLLVSLSGIVAAVVAMTIVVLDPIGTSAQEGGVYVQFGLPSELPAERDRNSHGTLTVNAGTPVTFWNRSGWGHQVAIYDKDLAKNGTPAGTTLLDITYPTTGTQVNDPVGRLALGPSPAEFGCGGPAYCDRLNRGETDFTYTFRSAGVYLVICNILPHMQNYGQSTFVIVK